MEFNVFFRNFKTQKELLLNEDSELFFDIDFIINEAIKIKLTRK